MPIGLRVYQAQVMCPRLKKKMTISYIYGTDTAKTSFCSTVHIEIRSASYII